MSASRFVPRRLRISSPENMLFKVISEYCKRKQQNRPFSHIVMDLHQEASAAMEDSMDAHWGPPAMPELVPRTRNRSESTTDGFGTVPRRWMGLSKANQHRNFPKLTREASTSMEDLDIPPNFPNMPGSVIRPKSMCVPNATFYHKEDNNFYSDVDYDDVVRFGHQRDAVARPEEAKPSQAGCRRLRVRRNPVQRSASRLYRAAIDAPLDAAEGIRDCVGPEFVVRASLPNKKFVMSDAKGSKKTVTVIMLDGQKVDVVCSPNSTTAGQLFETIIQKEHIEENFMLGLSALIAGDFVFLPSDTRICKVIQPGSNPEVNLTLFLRVRFFLPSLRGIRGSQARHLLYLQLRRSILEHQLPCSFSQIIELNGLALQAEFGNYTEKEHGTRDYFLLDHYVPETMACVIDDQKRLRQELIKAHVSKKGLEREKAEQDFIAFTQTLPHYGGHFYTATWILKDNTDKEVWLYISAQGVNLYERGKNTSNFGPQLYEAFEWRDIQTLCYSKHYLCVLPHSGARRAAKLKKYKLKMDHKKSYFAFRLASLHHQFFLRLRTEYTSLQTLSRQFGVPLKDIKNETNSLYKLDAFTRPLYSHDYEGSVNAETEFRIQFRTSSKLGKASTSDFHYKRSKSVQELAPNESVNEEFQNKENENPSLVLDSSCLAGLMPEKRRGVKMGTRAIANMASRVSRSMEAVNCDYLEQMSLQSVSLNCSSTSASKNSLVEYGNGTEAAYILDSTIKSYPHQLLPNFQESLNDTLIEKFDNISCAEERCLTAVALERDAAGSLGLQITEGSDGNVYVQSVIGGGPAHVSGRVLKGDQVVAVDGQCLLGMKYTDALDILKDTGRRVEFVLSRIDDRKSRADKPTMVESPVEKHLIESCHDVANASKLADVPYYLRTIVPQTRDNDKAIVVDMIPKKNVGIARVWLSREPKEDASGNQGVALPRSLGLGRKWKGPVRYPVTPVKHGADSDGSDDDQVFI
ncbi:tyrosine-protein phosphatase non-receptor type 13-like isoform X2 [Cylas formicarius]|uniref:tyrosine-protein phosphatase non-receptor type 13-like isoform X2 n=1 Tax=Cylas formicarius TaxID=197179 RepID=UPI0029585C29|nr:tyrosine-protein phosphatase non-receptor type 13-like isoform X2 [Cylas formicarius]